MCAFFACRMLGEGRPRSGHLPRRTGCQDDSHLPTYEHQHFPVAVWFLPVTPCYNISSPFFLTLTVVGWTRWFYYCWTFEDSLTLLSASPSSTHIPPVLTLIPKQSPYVIPLTRPLRWRLAPLPIACTVIEDTSFGFENLLLYKTSFPHSPTCCLSFSKLPFSDALIRRISYFKI